MRKSFQHTNFEHLLHLTPVLERNTLSTGFFLSDINDWNKLDPDIRESGNYNIFLKSLVKFIRPFERKTYHINGFN